MPLAPLSCFEGQHKFLTLANSFFSLFIFLASLQSPFLHLFKDGQNIEGYCKEMISLIYTCKLCTFLFKISFDTNFPFLF